jgi:hypothetical protein
VLFGLGGAFLVTCQVPRSARPLIRPRPAGFESGHIRKSWRRATAALTRDLVHEIDDATTDRWA